MCNIKKGTFAIPSNRKFDLEKYRPNPYNVTVVASFKIATFNNKQLGKNTFCLILAIDQIVLQSANGFQHTLLYLWPIKIVVDRNCNCMEGGEAVKKNNRKQCMEIISFVSIITTMELVLGTFRKVNRDTAIFLKAYRPTHAAESKPQWSVVLKVFFKHYSPTHVNLLQVLAQFLA